MISFIIPAYPAGGSFLFCTRSAFEASGGFDEAHDASEEVWLSLALRKRGRFLILRDAQSLPGANSGGIHSRRPCASSAICSEQVRGPCVNVMKFWYGERRMDYATLIRLTRSLPPLEGRIKALDIFSVLDTIAST